MTARDRELWDALVFDAYDNQTPNSEYPASMQMLPLQERRTLVINRAEVPTIRICVQSADESYTGERLAKYSDPAWWTNEIKRWTNVIWHGELRVAPCTGEPREGWILVREGGEGEVRSDRLAHANSW